MPTPFSERKGKKHVGIKIKMTEFSITLLSHQVL